MKFLAWPDVPGMQLVMSLHQALEIVLLPFFLIFAMFQWLRIPKDILIFSDPKKVSVRNGMKKT
jgi:hypothetical protein